MTDTPRTITFLGEGFTLAAKVGLMPMMRFAKVAKGGADSDDLAGLTAMYDLLKAVIAGDEWDRFEAHADATAADGDDLMAVVKDAFAVIAERPTQRPAGSSNGQVTTGGTSTGDYSSQVIAQYEQEGRPDLALVYVQAQEAKGSGAPLVA